MKITLLGTGTSQGVPVIGCDCEVCRSEDKLDQRLRCAVLINDGDTNILIDAGPDFRQQMLSAKVSNIDAILITHEHNDHIIGLDDVRPINFRYKKDMPVYALQRVLNDLKERFAYAFAKHPYPGSPQFQLIPISEHEDVFIQGLQVTPIQVWHGQLSILGFRIKDFVYLTDVKTLTDIAIAQIKNCKYLIINALHHTPHSSHLNLEECLALIKVLNPEKTAIIHVSHLMGLAANINATLPENVRLGYDGQEIFL